MNTSAFQTLPLLPELQQNLESLGFSQMTPVQEEALPVVMAGKDLIAQAKTGSGKTAAFGLGLLQQLDRDAFEPQALILAPTRELAEQIAVEIRRLARTMQNTKVLTLVGGVPLPPQANALAKGAQIIVGTPGRVEDHLGKGTLKLGTLQTLVLDEADRMLEMGFQESIEKIVSNTPNSRQTLLFSATFPARIEGIAKKVMKKPVRVTVQHADDGANIEQCFYQITDDAERLIALQLVLQQHRPQSALIFCATKIDVREVTEQLRRRGHGVLALHGDLEQRDRDMVMVRFANKSTPLLVATDVAARGLDIHDLDLVINYQPAREPQVYIHRIGRTGRAGGTGIACTLFTEREAFKLKLASKQFDAEKSPLPLPAAKLLDRLPLRSGWLTLLIEGGKKNKIRPGDLVGAITADGAFSGDQLGKITVQATRSYVAVERSAGKAILAKLAGGKIKGKLSKARLIGD